MSFIMKNEPFTCENCKQPIEKHPTWSARNHCPFCLFSKHLDQDFPGDRLSNCFGLMEPTGIENKKNKWWMVQHTCKKCGKKMLNILAPDDHFTDFVERFTHWRI